jgi:hypothetical protein
MCGCRPTRERTLYFWTRDGNAAAKALSITVRKMPAAAASRDIPERKALKSPPHVAAPAGAAKERVQNGMAIDRNGVAAGRARIGFERT